MKTPRSRTVLIGETTAPATESPQSSVNLVIDLLPYVLWCILCVQKNGVPLSRKTLINHARADVGFFRLICDLPQQFIEVRHFDVLLTVKN